MSCGAPEGGLGLAGVTLAREAVIQGRVTRRGEPVTGAYVRLLDRTGEFTAEVPTAGGGEFRFFAAEGAWTLRTLVPGPPTVGSAGSVAPPSVGPAGSVAPPTVVDTPVDAAVGAVVEVEVQIPA